jgi:predicted transglutaminase-like cysteine proteinase
MTCTKVAAALLGFYILLFTNFSYASIFRFVETKSRNLNEFNKWNEMQERFQDEELFCAKNQNCLLQKMAITISDESQNTDKLSIIKAVNSHVNSIKYIKDSDRWGENDYWATPQQFLREGGDCEDYAITKFTLLKKLGIKNKNMRLVVLKDIYKNIIHSVLVVYIEGQSYLLDNNIPMVVQTKEIRHYKPIYSINETNWWHHNI